MLAGPGLIVTGGASALRAQDHPQMSQSATVMCFTVALVSLYGTSVLHMQLQKGAMLVHTFAQCGIHLLAAFLKAAAVLESDVILASL